MSNKHLQVAANGLNTQNVFSKFPAELWFQWIAQKFNLNHESWIYSQDGVNVQLGDLYSAIAGWLAKLWWNNSDIVRVLSLSEWSFRWPRAYTFKNVPKGSIQTTVNDGIGTKVWLTDAVWMHWYSARDMIAMLTSDITRYGWLPLIISNVLDVHSLWDTMESKSFLAAVLLQIGLYEIAKEQKLIIINWETAELWAFVWSGNEQATLKYNRAGTAQWLYHKDKMILWDKIQPGDLVVALKENGFRSNGISSVRKAFEKKYWIDRYTSNEANDSVQLAAEPSVLYDRFLNYLNGRNIKWDNKQFTKIIDIHGLVHLSGGSFEWKFFSDLLKQHWLSAELTDLFNPPKIMTDCADRRGMNSKDFYSTRNGWQWMLAIIKPSDVAKFEKIAWEFGIEVQVAWKITDRQSSSQLTINSKLVDWETVVFK